MQYAVEAMRTDGSTVTELIEAGDRQSAVETLREKGLIPLKLDERPDGRGARPRARSRGPRLTVGDRILLTRQLKMLLEAGAPLVPALEAAEYQNARPAVQAVLGRIRERVEQGDSLSAALEPEGQHFDRVFRSMVAAGEATASLPQVFARLSYLAEQQRQARKMVVGALIYPAVLTVLLTIVVLVLLFFVVPRFNILFTTLHSPLPATTKLLFGLSTMLKQTWAYILAGIAAVAVGAVVVFHLPAARTWFDRAVLTVPLVGPLAARAVLASVLRVWAATLRCHVPLLESIRLSREAVRNAVFRGMIERVEEAVSSGGRMGQALAESGLVDPVVVSALRTGEENGRLAEAVDFVSSWLDEDNTNSIHNLTRLAEPLLLAVMGLIVGFVAMALFVPLFDLATAAA